MSEQVTAEPVAADRPPTSGVVARAVSWKALSVIVGQGCWYGSLLVLAILLTPRDFGVVAVGYVVVSLATLFLESGTGGAVVVSHQLDAGSVRAAVLRTSAAGIALTLLFAALSTPIADAFTGGSDPTVLVALSPVIALIALWVVPNALLMKYMQFKRIAIVSIAAALAASVAAVVAAVLGGGVWALVIRQVLYQAVLAAVAWIAAADLFPRVDRPGTPPIRRAGARYFLTIAAAGFLAWTGDNLVVAAGTNTTQLGLYALAFALAFLPLTQVSWMIGTVLLPAVASAHDPEVVRRQALKALRLMSLLLLPMLPAAIVLAPAVIPAVLGEEWNDMVPVFQILVVVGVGQGIVNVLAEVFAGAGGNSLRMRARIDVVWAVVTLVAIVIGVELDGIVGVAVAHVVTFSCLAVAYMLWGSRTIGTSARAIAGDLRGVAACVVLQTAVTAATAVAVRGAGACSLAAGISGAVAGVLALAFALYSWQRGLVDEARAVVSAATHRAPA